MECLENADVAHRGIGRGVSPYGRPVAEVSVVWKILE
jgi:hypothetical protein